MEIKCRANAYSTFDNCQIGMPHYDDVIMSAMASQITSLTIVYSAVYSATDERKHQSSASLAFVRGTHRSPVNSPHKGPVTRKMFPFDDVIMTWQPLPEILSWKPSPIMNRQQNPFLTAVCCSWDSPIFLIWKIAHPWWDSNSRPPNYMKIALALCYGNETFCNSSFGT